MVGNEDDHLGELSREDTKDKVHDEERPKDDHGDEIDACMHKDESS